MSIVKKLFDYWLVWRLHFTIFVRLKYNYELHNLGPPARGFCSKIESLWVSSYRPLFLVVLQLWVAGRGTVYFLYIYIYMMHSSILRLGTVTVPRLLKASPRLVYGEGRHMYFLTFFATDRSCQDFFIFIALLNKW